MFSVSGKALTEEQAMTVSTRYIVQVLINGEWKTYLRTMRSKGYTLTVEEAMAYLGTLDQTKQYRIVKSVCENGLINQTIAHQHVPFKSNMIDEGDGSGHPAPVEEDAVAMTSAVEKVFQAIADGGNSQTVLDTIKGAHNLSKEEKAFYGSIEA
jgi:hypothetical protein